MVPYMKKWVHLKDEPEKDEENALDTEEVNNINADNNSNDDDDDDEDNVDIELLDEDAHSNSYRSSNATDEKPHLVIN
jgi:hypothetical protein